MSQQYSELSERLVDFIEQQKIFFVATATADSRINLSPKGMDSLRIVDNRRVLWLNVTGSGNETAAHVRQCPRMTLMFCAFTGNPLILRLYGQARAVHQKDADWAELYARFDPLPGARQIFDLSIEMVQTSCGLAVPFYDFNSERDQLKTWAENKGAEGIEKYWEEKNQASIDGIPTGIVAANLGK